MATTVLSKSSVITVNAVTLTDFVDSVTFTESVDSLDVTTFGNSGHRKRGGLTDGIITLGGVYDSTTGGPHDVLMTLVAAGTPVAFQWRPEGTGSGLAQYAGNVLIQNYVEDAKVADIVRWTAALEIDGSLTLTNQ